MPGKDQFLWQAPATPHRIGEPMTLVKFLRTSGKHTWINPSHVTHVTEAMPGKAVVHLVTPSGNSTGFSGDTIYVEESPEHVARSLMEGNRAEE